MRRKNSWRGGKASEVEATAAAVLGLSAPRYLAPSPCSTPYNPETAGTKGRDAAAKRSQMRRMAWPWRVEVVPLGGGFVVVAEALVEEGRKGG